MTTEQKNIKNKSGLLELPPMVENSFVTAFKGENHFT
jgi:hypothetical protein